MSIASAIQNKQAQIASAYTACGSKGITLPPIQNRTLTNLAETISAITASTPVNQKIQKWVCSGGVYTREEEIVGANYMTVPAYKFQNNTSFVSVLLPDTVNEVRQGAFDGCTNLKYINLDNVRYFIINCFRNCNLEYVHAKDVRNLEGGAFYGNANLVEVSLSSATANISIGGNSVFQECTSLKKVTVPETTTSLGNYCFTDCTNLEELNFPQTITHLGAICLRNCIKLEFVCNLPNLTSFDTAFQGCGVTGIENLGSITNCGGNSSIASCTKLTYAKLPSTFTSMGNWLFASDTALTTVYIYATTPPDYGTAPFQGCSSLAHIYVPSASVSAYQGATGWSAHASIISAIPS